MRKEERAGWTGRVALCREGNIHFAYGPVTLHIDRQDLPHLMLALVKIGREIAKGVQVEEREIPLH